MALALCTGYRAEEYSGSGEGEEYRNDGGAAGSDGCLVLDGDWGLQTQAAESAGSKDLAIARQDLEVSDARCKRDIV